MIGLLIQDNAYEQDIRELLMSFYPGEAYAHEVKDGVSFYVETRLGEDEVSLRIWERAERAADGEEALLTDCPPAPAESDRACPPSGLEGWRCVSHGCRKTDLSDRTETKNVVKKLWKAGGKRISALL